MMLRVRVPACLIGGVFAALHLAGVCHAGAPPAVTRGPYLQLGTPTSIVVRWRTDTPTASRVVFGPSHDALGSTVESTDLVTDHGLTLSGLEPDSTVCYAVGNAVDILAGGDPDHCFETPPLAGTRAPLRVWVLGDSGTGNAAQRDVRDAYYGYPGALATDVWLMLGDNAYPRAADESLQSRLFEVYPEMLRRAPLFPSIGNHNGSSDSPTQEGPYFDAFDLPAGGEAGGLASGTEAYYAFDRGNVHFAVLDSFDTDASVDGAMLTWLAADLAATAQDWVVVYFHHGPYSKGSRDSDVEAKQIHFREVVVPLLDAYGVDLTMTGHSHSYERSFLIAGHYGMSDTFDASMQVQPGDGNPASGGAYPKAVVGPDPYTGIVHVVAGSSGQIDGGTLDHPAMAVSLNLHGSLVIDVDGQRMDVRFLDRKGAIQDHFAITKAAGVVVPQPDFLAAPTGGTVPLNVTFTDLSTHAPDAWSWDFDGDGMADSAAQHPAHGYTDPGVYDVSLTAGNAAGADTVVMTNAVCAIATDPLPLTGLVFGAPSTLYWTGAPDAAGYDVARTSLSDLRGTGGWSSGCGLGPVSDATATDPTAPRAGGLAYLTRTVDCLGIERSWDSIGPGQAAPRGIGVLADCP